MNNIFFERMDNSAELQKKFVANDMPKLITVEVLYYLPDYPSILQTFICQLEDISPNYPTLDRFLSYWEREIVARINSVRVVINSEVYNPEFRCIKDLIKLL